MKRWKEYRLQKHEGFSATPYRCPAGFLTCGIGHNLDANPLTPEQLSKIKDPNNWTLEEAYMILDDDIEKCEKQLATLPFWKNIDIERRYAMLDLCFNLGFQGLLKFKKFLKAMEELDFERAAEELVDSKWYKQVGKRALRIVNLIASGTWNDRL